MTRSARNSGFITKPWLVVGGSLAVAAVLVLALWKPSLRRERQDELVLFCAAGLMKPVQEVCAAYEKEYGTKVRIEPDASGPLLSKLRVAPDKADLFLAGEESYMRDARAKGLVAEVLPVARQHLVIAVKPGNPRKITGVDDLLRDDVKVALPNAELAAAGRTAQKALAGGGQWKALEAQSRQAGAKVSMVGKVTEAAGAVKVGTADAAVVWDANARQYELELVDVPAFRSQPPEPALLGVVSQGRNPTAALHFARYLTARDRGEPVFKQHFYEPLDDADVWEDRPTLLLLSGAMLKPAVDELLKAFEQREGVSIDTVYAGCGIHVAQMKALKKDNTPGKRFPDAYFACDVSFMNMVQQWFEASHTISRNDMVLVAAKGNPLKVQSIADLARPELRVGLAHPTNSALGALTDDLLKKLRLHEKVYAAKRKQDIVHTDAGHMLVNQMRAGALDVIVVYRSNVLSAPENTRDFLEVVEMNLPEAIAIQPYAVAKDSQHKYLMRRLLEAILAPQSQQHFQSVGFQWVAKEEPQ